VKENVTNSVSLIVSWPVGAVSEALSRVSGAAGRLPGADAVRGAVERASATASHLPGVGLVRGTTAAVLDGVGSVSPRARRVAVYTGAAALGVVGMIEWPVAAGVAGVAWLTQSGQDGGAKAPRSDAGSAPRRLAASAGDADGASSAATTSARASGRSSGRGGARTGRRRTAAKTS
jgi:hypothetical protein